MGIYLMAANCKVKRPKKLIQVCQLVLKYNVGPIDFLVFLVSIFIAENVKETFVETEFEPFISFAEKLLGDLKSLRSGAQKAANNPAMMEECVSNLINASVQLSNITKQFAVNVNVPLDEKKQVELLKAQDFDIKKSAPVANDGASTSMEARSIHNKEATVVKPSAANKPETVETSSAADNNSNDSELEDSRALRDNLNQKQRWLETDSSGASMSASDYDEDYSTRQRNKKNKKLKKKFRRQGGADQFDDSSDSDTAMGQRKLSAAKPDDADDTGISNDRSRKNSKTEFNVDDYYQTGTDDDEILIKNEPVIDTQRYSMEENGMQPIDADNRRDNAKLFRGHLNAVNNVESPIANIEPNTIDKSLNESIDYEPCTENGPFDLTENMDLEADFYGFHENNNDDLRSTSLFEIGVKTELLSHPVDMDKEKNTENENDSSKKTANVNESAVIDVSIGLHRDRKILSTIDNIENFNELGDTLLADDEPDDCLIGKSTVDNANLANSRKDVLLANGIGSGKGCDEQIELSPKANSSRRSSLQSSLGKFFDNDEDDDDIRSPFDTAGMNISSEDSDLSNLAKPTESNEGKIEKALVNGKQAESGDSKDADKDIDDINDKEIERQVKLHALFI